MTETEINARLRSSQLRKILVNNFKTNCLREWVGCEVLGETPGKSGGETLYKLRVDIFTACTSTCAKPPMMQEAVSDLIDESVYKSHETPVGISK